jgi:hypothetical protein
VRQRQRMRSGETEDAVAGAAQRRVNAKNHAVRIDGRTRVGLENRHGRTARSAAEALFHLFKLPQRNAHAWILPAAEKQQKQKCRASLPAFLIFVPAGVGLL